MRPSLHLLPAPPAAGRVLAPPRERSGPPPRLRIAADPQDPRRAVIGGTAAQVCAALEGMVVLEAWAASARGKA